MVEPNESEAQIERKYKEQRRAYYSEVITSIEKDTEKFFFGATKRTKYTWKVRTERFAPTIHRLIPPIRPTFLAPAERWMSSEEEKAIIFPVQTLKPKVQLQYLVDPKMLPRKVEMERRRREYAAKNIANELDELGVNRNALVPVDMIEKIVGVDKTSVFRKHNFLPLELFDDEDYDDRTAQEWISIGLLDGVKHPIPAEAYVPLPESKIPPKISASSLSNLFDWIKVAVTGYSRRKKLFTVLTLDGFQTTFKVPRIYVMFKAENPTKFAHRVKSAVDLRNKTENLIRYEFYIDCMLVTGAYEIDEKALERIFHFATRSKHVKITNPEFVEKLEREIRLNHKRALCEMQFRQAVSLHPQVYTFLTLPQREPQRVPAKGCIPTGMENFQHIRNYIRWYILYVIPESYQAIALVVRECQKVGAMSMFTTSYGKFVTLDEFQSVQMHTTNNVVKYIKTMWLENITHNIRMSLRDVGKGWFDLNSKTWDVYEISKMFRLLELTKYHMQYALRLLVENSVQMLVNLVETPCQCTYKIRPEFKWGKDVFNTQFKPNVQPVFQILLTLNAEFAFYSTHPDEFIKILLLLYNTAVRQTHFVKQVQEFLLPKLQFPDDLLLSSVGLLDPLVVALRQRLEHGYTKCIIPLKAYALEYHMHIPLFVLDVNGYIAKYSADNHSAMEVKAEVSTHFREKDILVVTVPPNIVIGPFYINVNPLRTLLIDKRIELATKLMDMFAARMREAFDNLSDEFKQFYLHLLVKPESIEQIYEMKEWIETVPTNMNNVENVLRRLLMDYDILNEFFYCISNEDFEIKWEVIAWPFKITTQIETTLEFLIEQTDFFYKIHLNDEINLQDKIDYFTVQVTSLSAAKDIAKVETTSNEVRRLWKGMKEAQEFGILLNQRQKLFLQPVVPFDALNKLIKEFEPYKTLWLGAGEWFKSYTIWMYNPLIYVDGESIDRICTDVYKTMAKMVRVFAEIPAVQAIAQEVKDQCEQFKPYVPLIQSLRNPGLKDRHYEEISHQTGITMDWGASLTFNDCLSQGLYENAEKIVNIAEAAGKEYAIEQSLDKMQDEWERIFLEIQPYKESGTYIVKVAEEHLQMLDDHCVATQQISFSPFKAAFEDRINEWEQTLRLSIDVIEQWNEVQKNWMYLEPIFTSEDIAKQLPAETKKYNAMERTWRRIMKGAFENNKLIAYCPDKKLLETLKECFGLLEIVQKGLCDYLETKRNAFPRFYFLSDDELLEILSQARNPLAVQPHLKKAFESISTLTFEADLKMTYMNSGDGESVKLNPSLYPIGGVENWLLEVENTMRNTLRTVLQSALEDMRVEARNKWVLSWPGQVVIAGSQTAWTADVENAISGGELQNCFQHMLVYLDSLRNLVKGNLTRLQREVISALIVIEVHARDVTEQLVLQNVYNVNDFDWISQLRYYWVIENELKVRAVNAEFQYGYEYLGNTGRLVITPLTDRCYLTLTGALHLNFGGAPAGPAGTGKTETTKDLGKAMAIQCVVFNCSDQLDYMAMGKFFKGLASAGAWACFDEFNRIDIEVLSVIAQQVTTIQKAQIAKQERFLFEGCDLALKLSAAVFITMNPGYAGRSELPDNLKALFRPVAMMVPNYTLIAEISLFSFGFGDARAMAGKITTTFKLSSEQLSAQDHYDFGMRAVKTVIAVAGNLKREKPKMDERQIILRALRDVNVPKFLKDDLKLFNGIVSDLFPRMVEEPIDYGILEQSIRTVIIKFGLEDVKEYVMKVIQLFETTVVRHGLMIVGPTGSGKTKCYEVLKGALTALRGKPSPSGLPFQTVHTFVLNPKSITMGQLYGEFDPNTHEWTDGILPSLVRVGASATDPDKRWYVFDGPVDAVWIENMNTVLDDNKKLCLTSGEIIKLKDTQTMMFEVADLAVASPATVSRCGMVFLEPAVLGLQPYLNCWLKTVPPAFKEYNDSMLKLFSIYVLPAVEYLRSSLREIMISVDSALVISCLNLLNWRLRPLLALDGIPPPAPNFQKLMGVLLVPWLVWAVIWSIGGTCDYKSREMFSEWIRTRMKDNLKDKDIIHGPAFPLTGIVYDFKLIDGGFTDPTDDGEPQAPSWRSWLIGVENCVITPETKFSDIEVPTMDNVRNADLLGNLLMNGNNVLCVGPTGTGKTMTIVSKLSKNMHKKFMCDFIMFSARTSSNQTQDLLDSKLEKRRKGIFGPPMLKKEIFFVDDFNMPALEVFGAQPPIELVRQWMDFSGWYDRKEVGFFRTIIDVNFVVGMGPPGGGRNPVTARLLRHFHYIAFTEMEDSSKMKIFGTIMKFWLDRSGGLLSYSNTIVLATLSVYTTVLSELLPTPAKTHYTFNLRDLSKVFQGCLMREPETLSDPHELLRLWYHESCRVFQDRMVNDQDKNWFDGLLREKILISFKENPDVVLECGETNVILFADYIDPSADQKPYIQLTDWVHIRKVLDDYLEEYNNQTTKPMKLVLFLDAICHVSKISRIIRQPLGNSLLLGMGGSGRQSLTRLAAHIGEFFCFQIELSKTYGMTEWRDDIKKCMLGAGLMNKASVFLFSDTQIKSESFLEDLNNILNSGDVPNIYQLDELDKVYNAMKAPCQEMGMVATKTNLFAIYQKCVRSNLHVCITMSPIGEIFRARLRQFPALVNCCTIDWFSAWPETALQSVALQFLNDIEDLGVSSEILTGIVLTCQYMHKSVVDASVKYHAELLRHNYVTPTSYLELLQAYTLLMDKKKSELRKGIYRLKTGMDKLFSTGEEVKELQIQLAIMKPALEIAAADAEVMIAQIAKDTEVAEATKVVVQSEERSANQKAMETQAIADDAQRDLDEALPALQAAEDSLKALNKNDITEVRAMKRPPLGVRFVIEAICIINDVKPLKVAGEKPGQKINDYWPPGQGMLSDPTAFLSALMNFDKSKITKEKIDLLKPYVENPSFHPSVIIKVSKACTSLCMWVHAMFKYYHVDLGVAPKKAALAQAKTDLEITEANLAVTKAKMKMIMDGLDDLNEKLRNKIAYKEEQEAMAQLCMDRMGRAVRLVGGLADERVRWISTVKLLELSLYNVTGDILLSSGAVAYLTPFTDSYRRKLLEEWMETIKTSEVPHTPGCTPVSILGEAVIIRLWQLDGLPRDSLSTENAVLVNHSRRWPLFIDPQGQANKWVRNMGRNLGISVVKLSDRDLIRTMESAIRFGKPVLIENVGEELDPALDPVLTRQVYRQGGQWVLKLGDVVIPYSNDFKLYITTKLANPHYTPEVSIKVLVVNFTLVSSGLQDQLLALVVAQERPDLEEARSLLVISSAQMKHELKEIEDRILQKLSASEGSPVDDIDLICTLEASKIKSEDIKQKVAAAEITQVDIDTTRALYIPVANRGQLIFFCVADLANIDPMYQYSLEWFTAIFVNSMACTQKSDDIDVRIDTINEYFAFSIYSNVCRSLFERNKLHFAFLLCVRILMDQKKINPQEWHYLLAGGLAEERPNPAPHWLDARAWTEICALEPLPAFTAFVQEFENHLDFFHKMFDSTVPHRMEYPAPWEESLDDFQKILILKCIRPGNVTNAMQDYLRDHLGARFIEPQTSDLSAMYNDSTPTTPLIFVLSAGTDPAADLYKFAEKMKMSKRMLVTSLGQGQGPIAEKMFDTGSVNGSWVFLQNCHLAPSWMPRLERTIENLPEKIHKDFRVWLTSTPSPSFPVAILQNGSKMTVEPPRGIKANMLKAYLSPIQEYADYLSSSDSRVPEFKWLLFSLCLFHGVCLERRKFGPLGFNIPYEFTDGDLRISISQLNMFLLEYADIPFKVLTYTTGHINYGGRVTDDWDRRCLLNILGDYYRMEVVDSQFTYDADGEYHQQETDTSLSEYIDYIRTLPLNDDPTLFGLHPNADISCARALTYLCLSTLLALQPRSVGGSTTSAEEVTSNIANNILDQLPPVMDSDLVFERYPVMYEESLNTVIGQEVIRYNRLLKIILGSLKDLLKALKGLVVMSEQLESLSGSLFSNQVPKMWAGKAYPSLKPLGAWVIDLKARVAFLQTWIDEGIPPVFWISGFFFPQAFLTGTLQNFARKYIVSIDSIGYSFRVLKSRPLEKMDDGCCIYGLYLEGCRWDPSKEVLVESRPKELYTDMPCMWLVPEQNHFVAEEGIFVCPVYKTLVRAGTLSTTGHSTNFVVAIEVPSNQLQSHWIKRGAALFCALDF